jgi:hypothetical protein
MRFGGPASATATFESSRQRAHTLERTRMHSLRTVRSSRVCKSECEWASARSPERRITLSKLCTHDLVSKSARHRRPSRSRSVIAASRACTPAVGRRTACAACEQASRRWAGGRASSARLQGLRCVGAQGTAAHPIGGEPDCGFFVRFEVGDDELCNSCAHRSRAPMAQNEELGSEELACAVLPVQCSAAGTASADLGAAKHAAAKL